MPTFHLATFTADVTPPSATPSAAAGSWRPAASMIRCSPTASSCWAWASRSSSVPWTGAAFATMLTWPGGRRWPRRTHTVAANVAVQTVHPHNAPFADTEAEKLIEKAPKPAPSLDLKFFDRAVDKVAEAAKAALAKTTPITHYGIGRAKVEKVASNRRIIGPDGKSKSTRYSATKDPKVRDEPEGLIDPWLRTLSFWNGDKPLAALHYYATHPMSYYGDGRVSSDFCGLARESAARKRRSFRSTSPAARATSPPASITMGRRRIAACCATASSTAWRPRGRRRSGRH